MNGQRTQCEALVEGVGGGRFLPEIMTGKMLHISFRPACGYRTWAPLFDILRASKHRVFDQSCQPGSNLLAYPRKRSKWIWRRPEVRILKKFLRSLQKEG